MAVEDGSQAATVRLREVAAADAFSYVVQGHGCQAAATVFGSSEQLHWLAVEPGMIVPNASTACAAVRNASVYVPAGASADLRGAAVTLVGNAVAAGADGGGDGGGGGGGPSFQFSAAGDRVQFSQPALEVSAAFALSIWVRAGRCASENQHAYIYSHVENEEAGMFDPGNSNVNVLYGCASAAAGLFLRFVAVDAVRRVGFSDRLLCNNDVAAVDQWLHLVLSIR